MAARAERQQGLTGEPPPSTVNLGESWYKTQDIPNPLKDLKDLPAAALAA